jgi:hypothetical protein
MPVDHIRYELLTRDALRGVVRAVLTDVALKGLPGDHHFYITFDTRIDGVHLSARLKAEYPEEMTIVLQHQFWELAVGVDDFDVGLAFGGIPERLHVPFRAVKAFADPSVEFALQFTVDIDTEAGARPQAPSANERPAAVLPSGTGPRAAFSRTVDFPTAETTPAGETAPADAGGEAAREEGSAEVVRLDRFRKK